ncbi:calcium-binding protein [Paracoccus seriniphilus]|uniref:Ca2+-binding protein, RTX toxin-related n=1 Tax=Paracoccus seriniphilus TaxID=184748 RepID=A0A239PLC5_9RHOB|nr:calcium-binding protein [Paracoccus seriniphilus]SNT68608.1 Ca2+-binding protein, RTX toxin-related [Paracoccus seriniphilus]
MLTYRHVVTHGAALAAWPKTMTDLVIGKVGQGGYLLFSTTQHDGGIISYSFRDPDIPLEVVDRQAFPKSFAYQGDPEISLLKIGGDSFLYPGMIAGSQGLAPKIGMDGGLTSFARVFPAATIGTKLTALGQFSTAAGEFIYTGRGSDLGLTVYRLSAGGAITKLSSVDLPQSGALAGASLDRVLDVEVAGQRLLVAVSAGGNFIATHQVGEDGVLGPGAMHVAAQGTGYFIPTEAEVLQFGGRDFLVVAGSSSSSLTVFKLRQNGDLQVTDHVIDERTTRFQSATALATAVVEGRGYVFAGGADDGISAFALLPDGRLLHLASIADDTAMSLSDVSDIEAQVIGDKIALFVSSATEAGVTQLSLDPGEIGVTAFAGSGISRGGAGDDLLVARVGTSRLEGGDGDDILVAGDEGLTLIGGAGADTFVLSRVDGRIVIKDFQPDQDRLDMSMLGMIRSTWQLTFQPRNYGMRISYGDSHVDIYSSDGGPLSAGAFTNAMFPLSHYLLPELDPKAVSADDAPTTVGRWLFGGAGGDQLLGGQGPDNMQGQAGNDTLSASGGDDTLHGDEGHDLLRGGDGQDGLYGGAGNDTFFGDSGQDSLWGETGTDLLYGGADNDHLHGGTGHDRLYGGSGSDKLYGEGGNDVLSGDGGDDLLAGGNGRDTLIGGSGQDRLYGQGGDDALYGGDGDDLLDGGSGNDTLMGENGDDTLSANSGRNLLYGGRGSDQLLGGSGDDTLLGGFGHDTLEAIFGDNELWGRNGNDRLIAGSGADSLYGEGGNDVLKAGAGADCLSGGQGSDTLYGQDGRDLLKGGKGHDYLGGGDGNDRIYGGFGNDTLVGKSGHDWLEDPGGKNRFEGGGGKDTLIGGSGEDRMSGGRGDDRLDGKKRADILDGGSGDDLLLGRKGADTLKGGAGDDTLIGGEGADWLYGGRGKDVFRYTDWEDSDRGGDADVIVNFVPGQDLVDLRQLDLTYIGGREFSDDHQLRWTYVGDETRIQIDADGDGRTDMALRMTGHLDLSADDFLF